MVYVDTGAIAAKLRQMTADAGHALPETRQAISVLRIKTSVNPAPAEATEQAHISSETLQHLRRYCCRHAGIRRSVRGFHQADPSSRLD